MPSDPKIIGDYRVTRVLGRGGMGAVYLADDPVLDRRVAIKVIDGYRDHPSARARFLVEARAIARLSHPNVVAVYRAGEQGGEPYLVSEFVDGTPLDRLPRPLDPALARAIALGLARGLGAAHRQGILHRDVKPGNAILGKDGTVKLLDFGLAKLAEPSGEVAAPAAAAPSLADQPTEPDGPRAPRAVDHDATRTFAPAPVAAPPTPATDSGELTVAGSRLGTPRYMAPEAWGGERLTAASDVFSLGLVLWELFGGRHPLADVPTDGLAAAAARVPSLATAAIAAPPAVVAVVDRAVAAEPGARFADADQLAVALEAAFAAPDAAPPEERPSRAAAAAMIGAGALALAGVAWVVRPRATPPAAIDAPALAAIDAGRAVVGPGVALTALGACANEPVFVDGTTVAFTLMRGADVDVYTVVPGQAPALAARSPGDAWDWHPARGRHPGEILYVTDGDDQRMRVKALSRATGGISEPMVGYAVAPTDAATFVLTDADPGWVHRHDGAGDARAVAVDAQADYLAASRDGARLAFVVADRASAPRLCVATVATARVECVAALKPHNVDPVFARDGRTLYYAAERGVRAIDLATGADRLVVPGVRTSGGLDVSPDGARLVYSDCHSYGTLIAVGRGAPEVLVDDGLARSPVGIPGGGLAWVARDPGGGVRLMVRSGAEPARALLRVDGELGRPAFSADGRAAAWAQGGASPGIHSAPVAGGAPRRWTDSPSDRAPLWLADGGLAFTRLVDGAPTVWSQAAPDAAPIQRLAGWGLEDRIGDRLLVRRAPNDLAWLAAGAARPTPIRVGALGRQSIMFARALPDGALAIVTAEVPAIQRLDPATGATTVLHDLPAGETLGEPAVLPDGRVAYRAEIWLGELYQLDGAW
ncbi:MAG: serine/threonine-protein kinase [Myxococcales bacterium]|nr:serine/threonine-protein kinase [Myxococcales bacterium]